MIRPWYFEKLDLNYVRSADPLCEADAFTANKTSHKTERVNKYGGTVVLTDMRVLTSRYSGALAIDRLCVHGFFGTLIS